MSRALLIRFFPDGRSKWIRKGRELGASDLHIEADTAPVARVRGQLSAIGQPIAGAALVQAARELLGNDGWPQF